MPKLILLRLYKKIMSPRVSSVRIVGGKFKGLKVPYKTSPHIRPTSNKNRETLFNWLMYDIDGAVCLDLFAGTGALGLEAISRGAKFVYFTEKNKKMCSKIKQTITRLDVVHQTEIINTDSLGFSFQSRIKHSVDIIFIDPPFRKGLMKKVFKKIKEQKIISNNSIIYAEMEKEKEIEEIILDWNLIKSKTSGQTRYCLFKSK